MATPAPQWLQSVMRAVDERWWLRHALFWLLRTAWMTWLFLAVLRATPYPLRALRDALLLLPPHMLVTYSLLYLVLPTLWTSRPRWGQFAGRLVAWLVLGLALTFAHRQWVLIPVHCGEQSSFADYHVVFATGAHLPLLVVAGAAACLHVYRRWRRNALLNSQLLQQNQQAELQLLKAQVHPHFLFNTLNNLYALTLRQSDQAPLVVDRLTGLLQFVTAQGQAPLVPLAEEVALLRNYVALEQLRYGQRLSIDFQTCGIVPEARITPLLLLPLVENAFKHGPAEQLGSAWISVVLGVQSGWLHCQITNTKNPGPPAAAEPAGIGLHNVRQRLHLLYPRQHRFEVEAHDERFCVRLALALPDLATRPADAADAAAAAPHLRPVAARLA